MLSRTAWLWLVMVFVAAVGTRVGWVVVQHSRNPEALSFPDERAYQLAGRSLAAGTGLVDEFGYRATYMPAYPAFIAVFEYFHLPLMWLRLSQAVLGALVAPATFMLARRWAILAWPSRTDGLSLVVIPTLAGLAAAFDPFLVYFSGLLLTETLYTAVLVAAWWHVFAMIDAARPASVARSMIVGGLLAGCIMLRPSATILVAIIPAMVLLYRRFSPTAWMSAGVVAAIVVLGLFPWAARNANVLGEWRWTTTRGGISLYDGLQPDAGGASDLARTKTDPAAVGLSELEWDRYWHDRAMAAFRQDPAHAIALAGRKILRTWNIVPNEAGHRGGAAGIVSAIWTLGLLAAAAIGWWQVRRAVRWWLALLMPVIAFTLLHAIFVGSVRYRIPVMPMLFVLAAGGVCRLMGRGRSLPNASSGTTGASASNSGMLEDPPR